jgi:hypothetical protein
MHKKPLLIVLFSMLLCAAGCAALPKKLAPLPQLADPAAYVQKALTVPPQAALSGIARFTVNHRDNSRSYKTVLACIYPDMLRLEVLGPFRQTHLYINANTHTGITLYAPSTNAWYRGPATPGNMQRICGIGVDPFEIVRVLHARPPGPDPETARIDCTQDNGLYTCTLESGDRVQTVWIDPVHDTVTRSRLNENGRDDYDILYSDFQQMGERRIPQTIQVLANRYAAGLEIKLSGSRTDPLNPEQLALNPPEGTAFLPLDNLLKKR